MTAEQYHRAKTIISGVWELEATERPKYLDRECAGDVELRRLIDAILAADEDAPGFLNSPVMQLAEAGLMESPDSDLVGSRVGPYMIQALVGRGGMGAVYRAVRQEDFRMEVAIKLLQRGTVSDTGVVARFRAERRILAELQHPNIARLLDGGTTEAGLPYLVMEFVHGTPLREHAARLPVRDRISLFRSVCDAVEYAHQHSIVHRDIKPANILVTGDGIPKLLDFGIAKLTNPALQSSRGLTVTGTRLMTPSYASPEQVRGEAVTAATDIYSLGTVLYELLTGRPPHSIETYSSAALEREICNRDPRPPSELVTGLDTDLDNIVLMALRKEPERRYASARALSEDLDRFLRHLPVRAHRETVVYRVRKFLKRRQPLLVTAVCSVTLAFVLAAGFNRFRAPARPRQAAAEGTDRRWNHLTFEKIAALGDPAPGGGSFEKYFEAWGLNSRGDLAFGAELGPARPGLFLWRRGAGLPPVQLARSGEPAAGGWIFHQDVAGYSMNASGEVAFIFELRRAERRSKRDSGTEGLFRYSRPDQNLTPLVLPGVTDSPGFGPFESVGMRPVLNNSGDIVFPGMVRVPPSLELQNNLGLGIFVVNRAGRFTKIVVPGDPAPGNGQFDFAQNPWINDNGDIAFGAHVSGEECFGASRLWCGESIYLRPAGGSIKSIAHQGEQGPLSVQYRYAWGPALNNRADLVFIAELLPPSGRREARGIFLHSRGFTTAIAVPGDVMPDNRRILTINPSNTISNYSINNQGEVCFNASLDGGESGFYVYSKGLLHLVAGTGTVLPGIGTIASVSSYVVNGGIINDSGQIFFWATMTDGKGVLLLASPPAGRRI